MPPEKIVDNKPKLSEVIKRLEEENRLCGGGLFATFGERKRKALVFPTPIETTVKGKAVYKYLMINVFEEKMVELVDDSPHSPITKKFVSDLIRENLDKKYQWPDPSGYEEKLGLTMKGSSGAITIAHVDTERYMNNQPRFYNNCKLRSVSPEDRETIIETNLKRAKNLL